MGSKDICKYQTSHLSNGPDHIGCMDFFDTTSKLGNSFLFNFSFLACSILYFIVCIHKPIHFIFFQKSIFLFFTFYKRGILVIVWWVTIFHCPNSTWQNNFMNSLSQVIMYPACIMIVTCISISAMTDSYDWIASQVAWCS